MVDALIPLRRGINTSHLSEESSLIGGSLRGDRSSVCGGGEAIHHHVFGSLFVRWGTPRGFFSKFLTAHEILAFFLRQSPESYLGHDNFRYDFNRFADHRFQTIPQRTLSFYRSGRTIRHPRLQVVGVGNIGHVMVTLAET